MNRMSFERRIFLAGMASGFCAYAARYGGSPLFAAAQQSAAKRCVVLWMSGGPSQMDTLDPKPGHANGGPTKSIATSVPGIHLAEGLEQVAKQMDCIAIVRNLTSKEGDHDRGAYTMHTGYAPTPAFQRPAIGSVISALYEESELPKYIALGKQGLGPAWLGPQHAPFSVSNPSEGRDLLNSLKAKRHRLELIQNLGREFNAQHGSPVVELRSALVDRISRVASTRFAEALDWEQEPEAARNRYGEGDFARNCLTAKRLIERGATFVEVEHGGWDTHGDNYSQTMRLKKEIDAPWAALLQDLRDTGLLAETMVVWMGEFGRTPVINGGSGRDHFPDITPVAICGGGISGQVVGATNASGQNIEGPSHSVADVIATLFTKMGVNPDHEFYTDAGALSKATDSGIPISTIVG